MSNNNWRCTNCLTIFKSTSVTCPPCPKYNGVNTRTHESDTINNPIYYTSHPSGIECIDITCHMNFCLGSAMKYIWRVDDKDNPIKDLKKAIKYIKFEIARREQEKKV